jgi:hypothetical protein
VVGTVNNQMFEDEKNILILISITKAVSFYRRFVEV